METSREDVGIAIRSAFLRRGTQQRFSLFVLIIISVLLILVETIETKPLNKIRSFVKDVVYRGAIVISSPINGISNLTDFMNDHLNLSSDYDKLVEENEKLKSNISEVDFLALENTQLKKIIDEQVESSSNLVSARVMLEEQSPYLNSFVINIGSNKNIKNGMAVLDGKNFIGRIVDVNFFSSRVLLVADLNSKIPILTVPSGNHAILSGHGKDELSLDYLPENHNVKVGDKIYTSGKEGIFTPGMPIGKIKIEKNKVRVLLFSDLSQITFVNIDLGELEKDK